MKINKILNDFEIRPSSISSDFTIPERELPKQRVDGKIITKDGNHRCTILYETIENQGRYGIIQACKRIQAGSVGASPAQLSAVVKRPRSPSLSLAAEAVLQAICYSCVEERGLGGSISKPHDLFLFANEVRFSMEYVDGLSFKSFIKTHSESEILNCIAQLCYILLILEETLNFDHRDLRIENVWIRPLTVPKFYEIGGGNRIEFKFQVVLLDFGFACIGDRVRKSLVNLGDGVFSPIDPCPKIGRDMYQFLNSCFEIGIQERLSKNVVDTFKEWMHPYNPMPTSLTYIITYDLKFKIGSLSPIEILRWYTTR
jgi:serine/threonine protein kinase